MIKRMLLEVTSSQNDDGTFSLPSTFHCVLNFDEIERIKHLAYQVRQLDLNSIHFSSFAGTYGGWIEADDHFGEADTYTPELEAGFKRDMESEEIAGVDLREIVVMRNGIQFVCQLKNDDIRFETPIVPLNELDDLFTAYFDLGKGSFKLAIETKVAAE